MASAIALLGAKLYAIFAAALGESVPLAGAGHNAVSLAAKRMKVAGNEQGKILIPEELRQLFTSGLVSKRDREAQAAKRIALYSASACSPDVE